ncbi:hypothetical protein EG329_000969 [Mollisiaceae sp. DMI_Dod_QoI]|nr:hypothetical protein EG329_000969 [Helotiales sp. DMI_Dod_QoI]
MSQVTPLRKHLEPGARCHSLADRMGWYLFLPMISFCFLMFTDFAFEEYSRSRNKTGEATRAFWPYVLFLAFNEALIARSYIIGYRSGISYPEDKFPLHGSLAEQIQCLKDNFLYCYSATYETGISSFFCDTKSKSKLQELKNMKWQFALSLANSEPEYTNPPSDRGEMVSFAGSQLFLRLNMVAFAYCENFLPPWRNITPGWLSYEVFGIALWLFILDCSISMGKAYGPAWRMNQLARRIRGNCFCATPKNWVEKDRVKGVDQLAALIEELIQEDGEDEKVIQERRIMIRESIREDEVWSWGWSSVGLFRRRNSGVVLV